MALKCPNCDANLEITDGLDTFYCKHCGCKIILDGQSNATINAKVRIKRMEHEKRMQDKQYAHERYVIEQENKKYKQNIKLLMRKQKEKFWLGVQYLKIYTIDGKTTQDIWLMTIDEGVEYFRNIDCKICSLLETAQGLLWGHLQIGEKTAYLSGGENVRIKLMSALTARNPVIGIDEPFKGLGNEEKAFKYFANHIYLTNHGGILTTNDSL